MKKSIWLFKDSDQKTRIYAIITCAILLLGIILVIVSASSALNGSITNIPALKLVIGKENINEFDERYEEMLDEIKYALRNSDDEKIEEFEKEIGMSSDKFLEVVSTPSIKNFEKLALALESDKDLATSLGMIIDIITGYAVIICILVVLAGVFMKKGLMIVADVVSAFFFFIFVGAAWFFIFTALCVSYVILVSKLNQAYKTNLETPAVEPDALDPLEGLEEEQTSQQ